MARPPQDLLVEFRGRVSVRFVAYVLYSLPRDGDDEWIVWADDDELLESTQGSLSSLKAARASLVESGWVSIEVRPDRRGRDRRVMVLRQSRPEPAGNPARSSRESGQNQPGIRPTENRFPAETSRESGQNQPGIRPDLAGNPAGYRGEEIRRSGEEENAGVRVVDASAWMSEIGFAHRGHQAKYPAGSLRRQLVASAKITLGRDDAGKGARNVDDAVQAHGMDTVLDVLRHRWDEVAAERLTPKLAACTFRSDGGGWSTALEAWARTKDARGKIRARETPAVTGPAFTGEDIPDVAWAR